MGGDGYIILQCIKCRYMIIWYGRPWRRDQLLCRGFPRGLRFLSGLSEKKRKKSLLYVMVSLHNSHKHSSFQGYGSIILSRTESSYTAYFLIKSTRGMYDIANEHTILYTILPLSSLQIIYPNINSGTASTI